MAHSEPNAITNSRFIFASRKITDVDENTLRIKVEKAISFLIIPVDDCSLQLHAKTSLCTSARRRTFLTGKVSFSCLVSVRIGLQFRRRPSPSGKQERPITL